MRIGRFNRRKLYLVNGLTQHELRELGDYNFRVSRGIVHTTRYSAWMAQLQRRFDEGERVRRETQERPDTWERSVGENPEVR
jgi:hypothetical protein